MTDLPVRACCGQRHAGPVCPDGLVMCCICFTRVTKARLAIADDGHLEDVCIDCADREARAFRAAPDEPCDECETTGQNCRAHGRDLPDITGTGAVRPPTEGAGDV